MRCIFCLEERPPSLEHVFPLAIGGPLTTDRVCQSCNSKIGARVDSALCDFLSIRQRRAELGLAGNSETPPIPFGPLLGVATLVGNPVRRIQTKYDPATGKLDHRLLHHVVTTVMPDGKELRQISIDGRDRNQIPIIIQRERKRNGLPPLSDDKLAAEVAKATESIRTTSPLVIRKDLKIDLQFLRHAMMKIAYELGFLWLGESYLDDPLAEQLRTAICSPDPSSADGIRGYVGKANIQPFWCWKPHPAHHLAYASLVDTQIAIAIRIFDIQAAVMALSNEPERYLQPPTNPKLRFLVIDSVSGRMRNTSFAEERHRLTQAMKAAGPSPVPDPLAALRA